MLKIEASPGYTFDDLLLVPRESTFSSRFNDEINLSTSIFGFDTLQLPIISANMDTVTELNMTKQLADLGGVGIIHRFLTIEEQTNQLDKLDKATNVSYPVIGCIGVSNQDLEIRLPAIQEYIDSILIDVAHGHSSVVVNTIRYIKEKYPGLKIMAGNVCTSEAVRTLLDAGADSIKCGVGPGSICTTRIKTGNGYPQLSAIANCKEAINSWFKFLNQEPTCTLVADGGIKNSGDIVKALAAGADAVMLGGLLAGTDEAPGETIVNTEGKFKKYRGMASREFQEEKKGQATSIEGESLMIPCKGPVSNILQDLKNGILSGMSYQGASNLKELRKNARFVQITAAGYRESLPHGLL